MDHKNYLNIGGTIRSQTAEETLNTLKPLLASVGITRVANVTGLDTLGIPVAVSIRPAAKHLSASQGKGLSWELAQISAVMESIESYHAENPVPPAFYGAFSELSPQHPVVNPNLFAPGFFQIPKLAEKKMGWIKTIDWITQRTAYIPHALICLDSTQPHPEYGFFTVSSNGLAAGNTLEEAICHGIYEVIERDCLCRWGALSDQTRKQTQLMLETVDADMNQKIISQFSAAGVLTKVWDISSAVGVPSFHCVIRDPNALRRLNIFRGTGTHLDKKIALSRALTEAAQSRLTLISGSRDDIFLDHYQQQKKYFHVHAEDFEGKKNFKQCICPPLAPSFADNIHTLIQQLTSQGFHQLFIVNHTKPELNIPVIHAFIPGMLFNGTRI